MDPFHIIRGHPKGLSIVLLTEGWENFALFGMSTILVFYLVKELHFSQASAVQIYAMSNSARYLMAIFGGFLADRVLGLHRAVMIGVWGMALGVFLLNIPAFLYLGIILITAAYGLFKPSQISQVNQLYSLDDPRRDRAFVLYKAGMNVGAIAAPLVVGTLGAALGWNWAIGISCAGMVLAALIYSLGHSYVVAHPDSLASARASDKESPAKMASLPVQLALVLASAVVFWAVYSQLGGTVALWLDDRVDRVVRLGSWVFEIPAAWMFSLNPVLIVFLTPVVNRIWSHTNDNMAKRELWRMIVGVLMSALAFLLLSLGSATAEAGTVSILWVVAAVMLISLGELYFDPVGQAHVFRYSHPKLISTFASIWLLLQSAGLFVTGALAVYWEVLTPEQYFLGVALVASSAVTLLYLAVVLRRRADQMTSSPETRPA